MRSIDDVKIDENVGVVDPEDALLTSGYGWCYILCPCDDFGGLEPISKYSDLLETLEGDWDCIFQNRCIGDQCLICDALYDDDDDEKQEKLNALLENKELCAEFGDDEDAQVDVMSDIFNSCRKVDLLKLLDTFEFAKKAVLRADIGWEGDIRGGDEAYIFFLPSMARVIYGFVWKQENNGMTFVWCPIELPYLKTSEHTGMCR